MVTGYIKRSFMENISLQKRGRLHETMITGNGKEKKSMSHALFICTS